MKTALELAVGSREDEVYANETRSSVPSTVGGVMTEEVGTVTGDLEVATRPLAAEDLVEVTVRYAGAEEWYTIEGSPIELGEASGLPKSELRDLHESVVGHLTTPGMAVEGNEQATPAGILPGSRERVVAVTPTAYILSTGQSGA